MDEIEVPNCENIKVLKNRTFIPNCEITGKPIPKDEYAVNISSPNYFDGDFYSINPVIVRISMEGLRLFLKELENNTPIENLTGDFMKILESDLVDEKQDHGRVCPVCGDSTEDTCCIAITEDYLLIHDDCLDEFENALKENVFENEDIALELL